jgi:hypothetical protein
VLSLERLLMRLGRRRAILPGEHEQHVAEELQRLYHDRQLFSVVPFRLGTR